MAKFDDLPETRRRGLEKMEQVYLCWISQQEAILTDLENVRMNQLRQMRMILLEAQQTAFTGTKHMVAFVGIMEELGIDIESILPGESAGEA